MNKTLLLFVACMITATTSAQISVKDAERVHQKSLPTLFDMKYFKVADDQQTPARSKSTGAYYKRPAGAYYGGFSLDGYGYYASTINFVPWQTATFENMIPGKGGTWHQYWYSDTTGENMGDVLVDPEATVVDGDYTWSQDPDKLYYTPTLCLNSNSFSIGEENLYLKYYNRPYYAGRILTDSVGMKNVADDHQRYVYNGQNYTNTAAWGALSDNMFGSGETDVDDVMFKCYEVTQVMERPMAPLYVESVVAQGSAFSRQPIAEGDTLKCYITNVVETQLENGTMRKVPGDKILHTLIALAEDTLGFSTDNADTRNGKTIYEGKVLFSDKKTDEFGIEYNAPIVLDPTEMDENGFAIVIAGFEKNTIDFGIYGWHVNDDVDDIEPGRFNVLNPNNPEEAYTFTYNGLITLQVGLNSIYDAVSVLDNDGLNVLRVSDDGQANTTDGAEPGSDGDHGAAAVYTAQPWFDEDHNEYYHLVFAPEWVKSVVVDESYRNEEGYIGLNFISVICEPLPAGTKGRTAQVFIGGRGVVSENPIILIQGNPEENVNLFSVDDVDVAVNHEADLNVSFNNGQYVVNGYQFDLYLPSGIKLRTDDEGKFIYTLSERYSNKRNVLVSIVKRSANLYSLICYSLTNEIITGEDGPIISLGIETDPSLADGDYVAALNNIVFSTTNGASVNVGTQTFTIHVFPYEKGDVNKDGFVNVADVMLAVNFILGNISDNFNKKYADLNNDNRIDVSDVMLIVNIILGNSTSLIPEESSVYAQDNLNMSIDGNTALLYLDNAEEYTAFQMTLQMPDGSNLSNVEMNEVKSSGHNVVTNDLGNGLYKIVVFSLTGEPFKMGDNELIRLETDGISTSDIKISDIQFTNQNFDTVVFSDVNNTNNINDVNSSTQDGMPYYNINGTIEKTPSHGVYIKNGKKVTVQ